MEIGETIKAFRKKSKLTLQQLSEQTGLSIGYLSNLERNISSPTLTNLQIICEKLKINLYDIINSLPQEKVVVKKEERRLIYEPHPNIKYELTTEGSRKMKGVCMTISEGDFNDQLISWGHHSDEVGVIVKGTMEMIVEDNAYILNEGDSVYIKAHTPHKYKKIGTEECVSYWTFSEFHEDALKPDKIENKE